MTIGADRRRLVVLAALLVVVGVAAGLAGRQPSTVQEQRAEPAQVGGLVKGQAEEYTAEPGKLSGESAALHSIEDYWLTRVSYPTGRIDTRWLLEAAEQDRQVEHRVPAGTVTYSREGSASPLSLDPNAWTALGPKPMQSDGCINCYSYGHVSGRVNDIEIDPVTPNVAYIIPVGGGVWKTTNCCTASTTFTPVTDDPLISTVLVDDISIDPSNHNTIYVGTGDLNYGSFSMGSVGILKSTDAGATWAVKGADVFTPYYPQPPGQFPQYQAVGKVEADPNNPNTVVAGTKTGLYLSYNGGDTWSGPCLTNAHSTQRQDVTGLVLNDMGTTTDMYVAVGTRGYSTTVQSNLAENGANGIYKASVPSSGCPTGWQLSSRPDNGWPAGTGSGVPVHQGGNQLGRVDIAVAPSNPNYVYAVVQAIGTYQGGVYGVWRTTDGGATWEQRAGLGNNSTDWAGCARTGQQNWYNQHIDVDPNNPDVVWVDTIDIFKSTNGADTNTNVSCGYNGGRTHVDQHAIEYLPGSSSVMLAGNDGGVYLTTNADAAQPTFTQLNDSLNTIEFYGGDITSNFATAAQPGINAGSQDNGSPVYVWTDGNHGEAMWQLRKGGDGMFARIEPMLGQRWYQESQNGNLAVTTAGPYSSQVSATGGWTADRRSFVFPYEIYKYDCPATGCTHLIAGSYRVWETILGGTPGSTWYANSPDLTKNTLADRSIINQLSYAVSMSTTAVVGTNDGNFWYGFGLGQGTANSATWVDVTAANAVLPNRPILDVTTDPVNPLVGYAAVGGFDQNTPSTPGHVYQVTCTANCASFTWANKSGNLPNIPVDSILANPRYPQQVFAGTDWGLYYTNDVNAASPTWFRFQTGMPNVMIWDMSIDHGFTTLAVFTRGRGAYAWPLPTGPFGGTATPTSPPGSVTPSVVPPTATSPAATATSPAATATATVTAPAGTATSTRTPTNTPTRTNTPTTAPTNTPTRTWTASPTPTCAPIVQVVQDGSFEAGAPNPFWDEGSTNFGTPICDVPACGSGGGTAGPRTGSFWTWFGGIDEVEDAFVSQPVTLPAGQAILRFYVWVGSHSGGGASDYMRVMLDNFEVFRVTDANTQYDSGYTLVTINVSNLTGGPRTLSFISHNGAAGVININVDDVSLETGGCPPAGCQVQFTDVPPTNTFYANVRCLACKNIVQGYPCGGPGEPCDPSFNPYFRPNNPVTRGQLAKIVSESAGFNEPIPPSQYTFTDVPYGSTFWLWVERLAARQVMSGYACGGPNEPCDAQNRPYFRPGNGATRGQLTKIVSNAAAFNNAVPPTQQTFADVPPTNTFWLFVERLLVNRPGVMGGYPCGGPGEPCDAQNRPYFRPNNPLTRGQTSKIVANTFFENCNPGQANK